MTQDNCVYRKEIICRFQDKSYIAAENTDKNCELCLAGQQIESIELLTSAVMNASMGKLESSLKYTYQCSDCQECCQINSDSEPDLCPIDGSPANWIVSIYKTEDDMHEPN